MAVIPKPASTVVLMDQNSKVYLTKRPKTMKFLSGFYVFPGGAVEFGDYKINYEFIRPGNGDITKYAYYIAAARELFEEVGILLCSTYDGFPVQLRKETEKEYRRKLIRGEISFPQMLEQEELYLNLNCLKYFGNLITPKKSTIRYDTRFFMAQLPKGQDPKPDGYEIDHASWYSPKEALNEFTNGKMLLAKPTIHALKTIINYLNGSPLIMPELQR